MDELTRDEARGLLAEYAAVVRSRDDRIRAALDAGLSISEVSAITEIARTTIYRAVAPARGPAALPGRGMHAHDGLAAHSHEIRADHRGVNAAPPLFLAPPTPAELARAAGLTE